MQEALGLQDAVGVVVAAGEDRLADYRLDGRMAPDRLAKVGGDPPAVAQLDHDACAERIKPEI